MVYLSLNSGAFIGHTILWFCLFLPQNCEWYVGCKHSYTKSIVSLNRMMQLHSESLKCADLDSFNSQKTITKDNKKKR